MCFCRASFLLRFVASLFLYNSHMLLESSSKISQRRLHIPLLRARENCLGKLLASNVLPTAKGIHPKIL